MKSIANIYTDFKTKFGVPRQSGLVNSLKGKIVFKPEYRNSASLRGLEEFTHIWLIWEFSDHIATQYSPLVRPPKLGGNKKMGVFATRSPYRPNPIGLSCVRLESIEINSDMGPTLLVSGADLKDKTPIYDIKPYIPYTDSHPEARGGFVENNKGDRLKVNFPKKWLNMISEDRRDALIGVLELDPRPGYHNNPKRIYGFEFAGMDVRFTVNEELLTVEEIVKI